MLVVAAAFVCDGRVLAGERMSGGWEFPGGKVEPGESEADAVVRELREELAVSVRAVRPVGTATEGEVELRLWLVAPVSGTPTAGPDHRAVRWVGADELDDVDWLPVDRALLDAIRALLS